MGRQGRGNGLEDPHVKEQKPCHLNFELKVDASSGTAAERQATPRQANEPAMTSLMVQSENCALLNANEKSAEAAAPGASSTAAMVPSVEQPRAFQDEKLSLPRPSPLSQSRGCKHLSCRIPLAAPDFLTPDVRG